MRVMRTCDVVCAYYCVPMVCVSVNAYVLRGVCSSDVIGMCVMVVVMVIMMAMVRAMSVVVVVVMGRVDKTVLVAPAVVVVCGVYAGSGREAECEDERDLPAVVT